MKNNQKVIIFIVFVFFGMSTPALSADFDLFDDAYDNGSYVKAFPNQNRLDNRALIKQQQRQQDDLDDYIRAGELLLTIVGLNVSEIDDFALILKQEFDQIRNIDAFIIEGGLAGFAIVLSADPRQFAQELEVRTYGPFQLELVRFRKKQMDFILK